LPSDHGVIEMIVDQKDRQITVITLGSPLRGVTVLTPSLPAGAVYGVR